MDLRKAEQIIDKYHLHKAVQVITALILIGAALLAALVMRRCRQF